jgi:colicin import membrane protein
VAKNIKAEFSVTLLPGGEVLNASLAKSSGNEAYDNAVERAILKAQPLPLPPAEQNLFNKFRDLRLKFSPAESGQ